MSKGFRVAQVTPSEHIEVLNEAAHVTRERIHSELKKLGHHDAADIVADMFIQFVGKSALKKVYDSLFKKDGDGEFSANIFLTYQTRCAGDEK